MLRRGLLCLLLFVGCDDSVGGGGFDSAAQSDGAFQDRDSPEVQVRDVEIPADEHLQDQQLSLDAAPLDGTPDERPLQDLQPLDLRSIDAEPLLDAVPQEDRTQFPDVMPSPDAGEDSTPRLDLSPLSDRAPLADIQPPSDIAPGADMLSMVDAVIDEGSVVDAAPVMDTAPQPDLAPVVDAAPVPLELDEGPWPEGILGEAYSHQLQAEGGTPPLRFEAEGLPGGLEIDTEGLISGTPEDLFEGEVQIRIWDEAGESLERSFELRIRSAELAILNAALPPASLGQAYRVEILSGGGLAPIRFWAEGLPEGFILHPLLGLLMGSPQQAGEFEISLTLTDAEGSQASRDLQLIVEPPPLNISTQALPDGRVHEGYHLQLQAASGTPAFSWSAEPLPQGLSLSGDLLSGTPQESGLVQVNLGLSDASGQLIFVNLPLYIAPPRLFLLTETLPPAPLGQLYEAQIQTEGGMPPLHFQLEGLPPGFSLDQEQGIISGDPEASGIHSLTLRVMDSSGQQRSRSLSLLILRPSLELDFGPLPEGVEGELYPEVPAQVEGVPPFQWRMEGLPEGMLFDPADQRLKGTPRLSGRYPTALFVEDGEGQAEHVSQFLEIRPGPLSISTADLPPGWSRQPYEHSLLAEGGLLPRRWSAQNLPENMSLSQEGLLSGIPSQDGAFQIGVSVEDSAGQQAEAQIPLQIQLSPLRLLTQALPDADTGHPYAFHAEVEGGRLPYSWSLGIHPALGLSIDTDTGMISGRARGLMGINDYPAALTVADAAGQQQQLNLSIHLNVVPLSFELELLPDGYLDSPYEFELPAVGGAPPYQWSAAGLPRGLMIGRDSGMLTGQPSRLGSLLVTLAVTDTRNQRVEQRPRIRIWGERMEIVQEHLPEGRVLQEYRTSFEAQGGLHPVRWSAEGLPEGLVMRDIEGEIYGTPQESGAWEILVIVEDSEGQIQQKPMMLFIIERALLLRTMELPPAQVGLPYGFLLNAVGGLEPYTWEAEGLPVGILLDVETGALSGEPQQHGEYSTTLSLISADGQASGQEYPLLVNPRRLVLNMGSLPPARVGEPYEALLEIEGGLPPVEISASGLPPGIILEEERLHGSPESYGLFPVDINISTGDGQQLSQSLSFEIAPPFLRGLAELELPNGALEQPYAAQLEVGGGVPPYNFESGPLPPGLSLSRQGALTGTPMSYGHFEILTLIQDAEGQQAGASARLEIQPHPLILEMVSLPRARMGVAYDAELEAQGGAEPLEWSAEGLPPGLFIQDGRLQGEPSRIAHYELQLQVRDAWGQEANQALRFDVEPLPLELGDLELPSARIQEPYLAALNLEGGLPPFSWSMEGLPAGLLLDEQSGLIQGIPEAYGLWELSVRVQDAWGQELELGSSLRVWPPEIILESQRLPDGITWQEYSAQAQASGGVPPYTWTATLPRWLEVDPHSGVISGIPVDHGNLRPELIITDSEGQILRQAIDLFIEYHCAVSNDGVEVCDRLDNDCDDQVDEGFDFALDPQNCGGCGQSCDREGAETHCAAAQCILDGCLAGHHDLDGIAENGCEYVCVTQGAETCNEVDDDCNGFVDEGFDLQADVAHCGGCGQACALEGADPRCEAGRCLIEVCRADRYDLDNDPENGCEYACQFEGVERCDELDNDCDGEVDNVFLCQETQAPEVSLHLSQDLVGVGEEVQIWIEAQDFHGVEALELELDGASIPLDDQWQAHFSPELPGRYELRARAWDPAGNEGWDERWVFVPDPGDVAPPEVWIDTPEMDTVFQEPVIFSGTVDDSNLFEWRLSHRRVSESEWVSFATGTRPVLNGELARLDPASLEDGLYEIRLQAEDMAGRIASHARPYGVEVKDRVGFFTLTIRDLRIPVAGIPIIVERIYDSRVKSRRDFGVGWTLGVSQGKMEHNRPSGEAWEIHQAGGFFKWPCGPSQELEFHTTEVRISNQEWYKFRPYITPTSPLPISGAFCQVTLNFEFVDSNIPGQAELDPMGGNIAVMRRGEGYLQQDIHIPEVYEVNSVRLTTPDGRRFFLNGQQGVLQMDEPNGNQLRIDDFGVHHSSGKEILFERDELGRITQMIDPDGEIYRYRYNAQGDLQEMEDPVGLTASYEYDANHFLHTIQDPSGLPMRRQEYDVDGRLVAVIDAEGNRREVEHNPDERVEAVTDHNGNEELFHYDEQGNVLEHTDALGQVWNSAYDADGNQIRKEGPDGAVMEMAYNADGNLSAYTDGLGNVSLMDVDGSGHLTRQEDPGGGVTIHEYEARGNRTRTLEPDGSEWRWEYDGDGLLTLEVRPDGGRWEHDYDRDGNRTVTTNALGEIKRWGYNSRGQKISETQIWTPQGEAPQELHSEWIYDAAGRLVETIHPDGSQELEEYNERGLKSAHVDRLGRRTESEYDSMGREALIRLPDGGERRTEYNSAGKWSRQVDPLGRITLAEYDALDRLTAIIHPDGSRSEREYDPHGRLSAFIDEESGRRELRYDAAGRLTEEEDPLGRVTRSIYNDRGDRLSKEDSLGRITRYEYDARSNLTATIHPDGAREEMEYGPGGRLLSKIDPLGRTTTFRRDLMGRLAEITDAEGGMIQLDYDELGNLISVLNPNGETTLFDYDADGHVIGMELPLGQRESALFDAGGQIISKTDALGRTLEMAYDLRGRPIRRSAEGAEDLISYNLAGERTQLISDSGTINFEYDLRGRLAAVDDGEARLEYSRDAVGRITRIQFPGYDLRYSYDAAGQLSALERLGERVEFSYDLGGRLTEIRWPNDLISSYEYDLRDRPLSVEHERGGVPLASYAMEYNLAGERTRFEELHTGREISYRYDGLGRLLEESITEPDGSLRQRLFSYDANGNRLSLDDSLEGLKSWSYDANDRLLTEGVIRFEHDAVGNLVRRIDGEEITQLDYDAYGRLISVDEGQGPIQYSYDLDGNRVGRSQGEEQRSFVLDRSRGWPRVLAETDDEGEILASYAHAGQPLLQWSEGASQSLISDGSRSIRQLLDGLGQVVGTSRYGAYGQRLSQEGAWSCAYGYRGEYEDPDTEFYYLRARWMSPQLGRFISRDPRAPEYERSRSLNRYAYAFNDPINYMDPEGEFSMMSVSISISIMSIMGAGLGIYGYITNTNEREEYELNATASHSVWGMAAALAISTASGIGMVYGMDGLGGGKADAVRHCTWNAIMAIVMGADVAARVATAHEDAMPGTGNTATDRAMDLHNNSMGRSVDFTGGIPQFLNYWLGPVAALIAWPVAAGGCIGMQIAGQLQILDMRVDPWLLVPSNTPGIP